MCAILDNYDREGLFFLPFFTYPHFFRGCHAFFKNFPKTHPHTLPGRLVAHGGGFVESQRKVNGSQQKLRIAFLTMLFGSNSAFSYSTGK